MTSTRDKKLVKMLTKQRDINNLWIKSVKDLELELVEKTERLSSLDAERKNLKKLLQKKLMEVASHESVEAQEYGLQGTDSDAATTAATAATVASATVSATPLEEIAELIHYNDEDEQESETDEFFDAEDLDEDVDEGADVETISGRQEEQSDSGAPTAVVTDAAAAARATTDTTDTTTPSAAKADTTAKVTTAQNRGPEVAADDATVAAEAAEKQAFPAVDAKDMASEVESDALAVTKPQKDKKKVLDVEGSYLGYEDGVRTRLKLGKDDRPKVSLWSVLKSMVGKDMTRMTLPVSFNEPTSLLQRVAEDLEYAELLDQAASFEESALRMLYIGVFSASSYASTTKRVAKPFNPLLGETYEYSRPDKHYRFFTEQVSHHPPISATWTESPKWDFWGESYVDSKFNGRSFDFKHLGLWYMQLRPDCGDQQELYTWKKPDNTVVGILLGNPQVDNRGDVKITNHTTGDYCVLHFKARGWRSTNAYEVRGEVFNGSGGKEWIFGGHWNDSIYAKKVLAPNSTEEMQLEKIKTHASARGSAASGPRFDGSKFLVWHAHERFDTPFNLTQYAITLNAPQPHLVPWLPPTDTRLRPDQRAMEEGRYDEAADEKRRVEEKQRAARKNREAQKIKYKPRWFSKEVHPLTRQEYWRYNGKYWLARRDHKLKDCGDIF